MESPDATTKYAQPVTESKSEFEAAALSQIPLPAGVRSCYRRPGGLPVARRFSYLLILPILLATPLAITATNLPQLRAQLERADAAADSDAVVELTRRILAADPHDTGAWTTLVETRIKIEDYD